MNKEIILKLKKLLSKKVNASFTIEAAVIIPISLVIIVTIFFVAFYLTDRVALSSESEIAILDNIENDEDNSSEITSRVEELIKGRILMSKDIGVSSEKAGEGYVVSTSGNFALPIPLVKTMLGEKMESVGTKINISNLDARKQLLKYKAVCDGLSGTGILDLDD